MKITKIIIISFILSVAHLNIFSQNGSIKGKITDVNSKEELTGATIVVQGTTKGTIADFEGNYLLDGLTEGTYNIVFAFISYEQQIIKATVKPGQTTEINITLRPAVIGMDEVIVKRARRANTEVALITDIKSKTGIVSGISAEQISKTQDKDAAEVVRRVPGITITNGKFIVVRGLNERYNSILLDGSIAPSFEADKRAFALDAIPSSMVENIIIYKSPAPELPADFAGAVIDIITKQNADKDELKISYSAGYSENASFNNSFQTYKGGKLDWLGFDDGTRDVPSSVPSRKEFQSLYEDWNTLDDYYSKMNQAVAISKDFNNIWTTESRSPFLDQSFSVSAQKRFTVGKMSLGNITAINYKYSNSYYEAQRTEYENYEDSTGKITYDFNYKDIRSTKTVNLGLIHNWILIFGNNQKIEFRNFYNNMGETGTSLRSGDYTYASENARLTNLRYQQRSIYSGQLAGKHGIASNTTVDWVTGYSFTRNNKPDNRIIKYTREIGTEDPYIFKIDKEVNVFNGGRVTQTLQEKISSAAINLNQKIFLGDAENFMLLKAGAYYDNKHRQFDNSVYGLSAPRGTQFLVVDLGLPAEELLVPENFFIDTEDPTRTGFTYKDASQRINTYQAKQHIEAGYLSLKLPIANIIDIYGGVRVEKLNRKIYDVYENESLADSALTSTDTTNLYPSVNISIKINQNHQLKFSYGKTVNHPEFREISPAAYYDFDLNAIVHGNTGLKDAYIDNYDARYEWYPNAGEMISFAAFYKKFENPIEVFLINSGTTYDYMPFNTPKATSKGLELDIRKKLLEFEQLNSPFRYLKDLTLVANVSVIRSEIRTDQPNARDSVRVMQGQSPYIINLGVFYDNVRSGTKVNLSYNKIGKRIVYAGTPSNPHTWELPVNSVDFNINQKIGKFVEINLSVKDLLNEKIRMVQYYGANDSVELPTFVYTPNRKFSAGLTVTF